MTVQTANRNTNQHYSKNNGFPATDFDVKKYSTSQKFEPQQQKYSSTSSAMQLKAKFGSGRNNGNYDSTDGLNQKNWKSNADLNSCDRTDGVNNKYNSKSKEMATRNGRINEGKTNVAFTPPTSRKTGGIGLRWEMQHSQESSTFPASLSSWKGGKKNVFSKSHSNIQDLAIDDKRGFIPSEVAKDPNQKEFLINLSKRIFSNPDTKIIQEEMQRRRTEETNSDNRKRSLSAGRKTGPLKISSAANGKESGRFQRTFKDQPLAYGNITKMSTFTNRHKNQRY